MMISVVITSIATVLLYRCLGSAWTEEIDIGGRKLSFPLEGIFLCGFYCSDKDEEDGLCSSIGALFDDCVYIAGASTLALQDINADPQLKYFHNFSIIAQTTHNDHRVSTA